MTISTRDWMTFVNRLSSLSTRAALELRRWVNAQGGLLNIERQTLIDYVFGLATKYGEGSSALAAAWYDAVAEASGQILPPAEPAPTVTYAETAKAVNGVLKQSQNEEILDGALERLVKMPGVDTTLHNAIRDGAEVAWIPSGDTCAFCLALAGNGWQPASRKTIRKGHAEHIHANCDCTYAVRFDAATDVAGYDDGRAYKELYKDAPLDKWNTPDGKPPAGNHTDRDPLYQQRINAMRREFYAENREEINAQKRSAYAKRMELNSSRAEEAEV